MKRLSVPCLLLGFLAMFASPVWAATTATAPEPAPAADKSPVGAISKTVATITGIAISPLLGTGALGLYENWQAKTPEAKAKLPWYAQWSFILPALAIVGLCAAKDSLGAMLPPGMKKPLDVLETIENKATGLVAAGAVVPLTMSAMSKMIIAQAPASPVIESTGLAAIHIAAIDSSWFLSVLTIPFGIAMFALVWMASHAINALILLSPWGAIDAALKGARTALLGLVTITATMSPWISLALSLIIILVAYLIAGWAFRLTIFGTIFSWEFFTLRKRRFTPAERENKLFSSTQLVKQGVPMRTYGRLINEPENGRLTFAYKPWMVLPEKTITVTLATPSVGKGLFFSTIRDAERTSFILPPRYRGHEEAMVHIYRIDGGVQDAGLLKAWGTLRELFGGSAAKAQVT
ncbi:hypothetical protein [Rariglobus hedericola]|uniref:Uncharacterized protein n=1 Tax=Rariglobus hedericola TaxID=2597822 RepID=A0A556QGG1_9BACT|nr:hypothetical protein [Rariglobus hedericola]TSJ75724.1 hypothetical protein FPL22_15765 [Rariglobus hedericola]